MNPFYEIRIVARLSQLLERLANVVETPAFLWGHVPSINARSKSLIIGFQVTSPPVKDVPSFGKKPSSIRMPTKAQNINNVAQLIPTVDLVKRTMPSITQYFSMQSRSISKHCLWTRKRDLELISFVEKKVFKVKDLVRRTRQIKYL